MPFICVAIIAVYLLFLPPPSSLVDSDTAADDTTEYDYYVDDQPLAIELPGKQSHSPLPDITYIFRTILALGIITAAVTLVPILLHIHFCRLLLYPTFILCCFSYAITSVGPTPLSISYA